ncbi:DUF397 domain-containing protein [Streptomyces chrestomyceticus]|uniref:DUF397 domain-containing protein n=1 Tax=Streptomyces chrestomyceticus TaxID=68185 RepID=UPI0033C87969
MFCPTNLPRPGRRPAARSQLVAGCLSPDDLHRLRSQQQGLRLVQRKRGSTVTDEDMDKDELYGLDLSGASWRKSSRSAYHIACVEVAELQERGVALRDSRNPDQGDLRFTPTAWAAFREGVRSGEFGRPSKTLRLLRKPREFRARGTRDWSLGTSRRAPADV